MLQHKTVLVTGIANSESIAFSAAVRASAAGARLVLAAFPLDVDSVLDCAELLPGTRRCCRSPSRMSATSRTSVVS